MNSHLNRRLLLAGSAAAFSATGARGQQTYPDRIVRIILPYAAGGPSDILGRILGNGLEQRLKQPFVVEYRPGASGNIGTNAAARATPDGYTLLIASTTTLINASAFQNVGFDPVRDFVPISGLAAAPCAIVASPQSGMRSLSDLIAAETSKPGSLNYATPGAGTPNHLIFETLQARIQSKIVHVPYAGGAPATQAVLSGTTQLGALLLPNVIEHIKAGALQAIALSGDARIADLPDVPTLKELGHDPKILGTFYFLVGPRGLRADAVSLLAEATRSTLAEAGATSRLQQFGLPPLAMPPDRLADHIAAETALYADLVRKVGLTRAQ